MTQDEFIEYVRSILTIHEECSDEDYCSARIEVRDLLAKYDEDNRNEK